MLTGALTTHICYYSRFTQTEWVKVRGVCLVLQTQTNTLRYTQTQRGSKQMWGFVNTLSWISLSTVSSLCLSYAVCEWIEESDIERESLSSVELRFEEGSFKNGMIKGAECVTAWLRVGSHTDLNSDQSGSVRRRLSFGGAMLTLSPRGVLLVMGSTRSDGCRFFFDRGRASLLQSGGPLTEPGALAYSGNVGKCWGFILRRHVRHNLNQTWTRSLDTWLLKFFSSKDVQCFPPRIEVSSEHHRT